MILENEILFNLYKQGCVVCVEVEHNKWTSYKIDNDLHDLITLKIFPLSSKFREELD